MLWRTAVVVSLGVAGLTVLEYLGYRRGDRPALA